MRLAQHDPKPRSSRGPLTMIVAALLLSCSPREPRSFPGELFRSPDGRETVKLIDHERVEVQIAGAEAALAGTYKVEKLPGLRFVITLPDASVKSYALTEEGRLVSPDTGALLARVPPS